MPPHRLRRILFWEKQMFNKESTFKARFLAFVLAFLALVALNGFIRPLSSAIAESEPAADVGDQTDAAAPDAEEKSEGSDEAAGDTLTTGAEEAVEESDEDEAAEAKEKEEARKHSIILSIIGGVIAAGFVALVVFVNFGKKGIANKRITSTQLTESAIMVAVATVCSMIKIDLPYGGGVTIVSMLPLVLISHRYGWRWGVTTAFAYSLIQLVLGLDNVGYATSTAMAFGVIFLDYIVAYTVIGLAGAFGKGRKGVVTGIVVTFFLRFVCHYVTGVWIWGGWMPDEFFGMTMTSPWIYSALYNGWYMLAELIITLVITMLIYKPLEAYFENKEGK